MEANKAISINNRNINGKEVNTVNARELYSYLNIKTKFADWIKNRIKQYDFVKEVDFTVLKFQIGKATQIEYYITLTMAKELAMVENNAKGKQARRYFIECERKLLQSSPTSIINQYLTNFPYEVTIPEVMGVETQIQCSCPTALVANSKNFQFSSYGGRALNKLAIANKASLSLYGFSNLPSPLQKVTCRKEHTMEALSIHKFHTHKIRSILINNEPYFVLIDICKVLQLEPTNVRRRLDKDVFTKHPLETNGGNQLHLLVNEDGLYDVIFESRKPEAKAFRKWVTSEVLPSIRKTGAYNVNHSPTSIINQHNVGFNNINQEAELVRTAKANLLFLISRLEELNIAKVIVNNSYSTYNYRLNKKEYVKKQTLKDYLQTQFNTLSQAFNSMYQPYYKEITKQEGTKKHKELQKYLTNNSGCSCN